MLLYRVFSESRLDAAAPLADLPAAFREELSVDAKPLARPPPYPPGARPGADARLDRYARSRFSYEVRRDGAGTGDPAKTALAGLALAARLARLAGGGLIQDVGAGVLLTPEEAERTRGIAEVPVGWLVTVHMVEGPDGMWVHTHGAGKLGLPELEAFGVAPPVASEAGRAMHKLLERWAVAGEGGAAGEDVPLPRGLARAVDAARGRARPAWSREPDEPGRRLALVNAEDGGDISRLFSESAERFEQPSFAERAAAQDLIARLRGASPEDPCARLAAGVTLSAKVAIEDELGVDVAWMPVRSWSGRIMRGPLASGAETSWPTEAVLALAVVRDGGSLAGAEAESALGLARDPPADGPKPEARSPNPESRIPGDPT